ncbi:MAG: DUF983 domain-containing protein [Chitinophagaceae bacterium]
MAELRTKRGYLSSALGCRCPRCREGKLFKHPLTARIKRNMEMNRDCPVCGQPTEIEVGFYYGTSYVSYALTVAISVASLIAWWVVIGLSLNDNRFFAWLVFNAIFLLCLQPWLMRISRSFWISWFVSYDPEWEMHEAPDVSERINPDQANNW